MQTCFIILQINVLVNVYKFLICSGCCWSCAALLTPEFCHVVLFDDKFAFLVLLIFFVCLDICPANQSRALIAIDIRHNMDTSRHRLFTLWSSEHIYPKLQNQQISSTYTFSKRNAMPVLPLNDYKNQLNLSTQ